MNADTRYLVSEKEKNKPKAPKNVRSGNKKKNR